MWVANFIPDRIISGVTVGSRIRQDTSGKRVHLFAMPGIRPRILDFPAHQANPAPCVCVCVCVCARTYTKSRTE